jgi:hypothetical protein
VADQPFRFDREASFDDEVVRIGDELNADLEFQLTERGDRSVTEHQCELHRTPEPATHMMTITKPGHDPVRMAVCEEDGLWVNAKDGSAKPPANMDPKRVEQLKPVMADPSVKITGRKIPEAPDRGPGGGPGGRAMAPDLPKPPPTPPDRTYPSYER